jgi:hypothetical protein
MSYLPIEDAIRLTRAKKVGTNWIGHCPTHDDKRPSLSISPTEDDPTKAIVYCHSSCGSKSPYTALMESSSKREVINKKDYFYKNSDLKNSLRVTRLDYRNGEKIFFQNHLQNEEWVKGTTKEKLCPYRFDEWKDKDELVFIVEGEKCADFLLTQGLIATTTPGGANHWVSEYAIFFEKRDVVILPDHGDVGEQYARDVYDDIKTIAKSVKVLRLPELKDKEDVIDWFNIGRTKDKLLGLVQSCGQVTFAKRNKDKVPLYRKPKEAEDFPVHALGNNIVKVVSELSEVIQAPVAIAAQSTLAAVNLAVQGHYNVLIDGREYPLSLYFLSSAKSGERKSSNDHEVLKAHRIYQENLMEIYKELNQEYLIKSLAFETAKKKITNQTKGTGRDVFETELKELGDEPIPPLSPLLFIEDLTIEGLFKTLENSYPCLGIFSDEGGQLLGGYSFNQDNSRKTAAALSKLWDGSSISRSRSGDGNSFLTGRRVAMHLMVQPEICEDLLTNPTLKDQGILNRILFSWPSSRIGERPYVNKSLNESIVLKDFWERVSVFLRRPLPIKEGSRNVLNPGCLKLSSGAYRIWCEFNNKIEKSCKEGNENDQISSYATRVPQQSLRIAGTLSVFNRDADFINEEEMVSAIEIAEYYLREFKRISEGALVDRNLLLAEKLLEFVQTKLPSDFCLANITQLGPNSIRVKAKALEVLSILTDHGYLEKLSEGTVIDGSKRKDAWRVL